MSSSNKIFVAAGVALAADQVQGLRVRAVLKNATRVMVAAAQRGDLQGHDIEASHYSDHRQIQKVHSPSGFPGQQQQLVAWLSMSQPMILKEIPPAYLRSPAEIRGDMAADKAESDLREVAAETLEWIAEAVLTSDDEEMLVLSPEIPHAEVQRRAKEFLESLEKEQKDIMITEGLEVTPENNVIGVVKQMTSVFRTLSEDVSEMMSVVQPTIEETLKRVLEKPLAFDDLVDILALSPGTSDDEVKVQERADAFFGSLSKALEDIEKTVDAAYDVLSEGLNNNTVAFKDFISLDPNSMVAAQKVILEYYQYIYSETQGDGGASQACRALLASGLKRSTISETQTEGERVRVSEAEVTKDTLWFSVSLIFGLVMTPLERVVYQLQSVEKGKSPGYWGQFMQNKQKEGILGFYRGAHINGFNKMISTFIPKFVSTKILDTLGDSGMPSNIVVNTVVPGFVAGLTQAFCQQGPNFMKVQTFGNTEKQPLRAFIRAVSHSITSMSLTKVAPYTSGFGAQVGFNISGNMMSELGRQLSKKYRGAGPNERATTEDDLVGTFLSVYGGTLASLTRTLQQTDATLPADKRSTTPINFRSVVSDVGSDMWTAFQNEKSVHRRVLAAYSAFEGRCRVSPILTRMVFQTVALNYVVNELHNLLNVTGQF